MIVLLAFAFVSGIITILSPCILPVLPIVLSGGIGGGRARPIGIITAFVLSFTLFTLALSAIVQALGIPPVLHLGSCVDNSRILVLAGALADYLGVDVAALPLAGAAPEWYSEKAVAIGAYVVASGITPGLGVQPPVFGSPNIVKLLTEGLEGVFGATFAVEPDPNRAAVLMRRHIEMKRAGLGLPALNPDEIAMPDAQLTLA